MSHTSIISVVTARKRWQYCLQHRALLTRQLVNRST